MKTSKKPPQTTRHFEELVTEFRKKAFLQQDLSAIDQHLTPDFVDHFAPTWDPPGIEGVRRRFGQAAQAFQTKQVEIVHSIRKGKILMQAIRIHLRHTGDFMGMPPTGKDLTIAGFDAFEFRGDKLSAHWGVYDVSRIPDLLGMGLGASTAPGTQPAASPSWANMWRGEVHSS
jgi:predicted ester cyclase